MNGTNQNGSEYSQAATLIAYIMYSNHFPLVVGSIWILLVTLAVIGNGLVIIIALTFKKLRDVTNFYIFNLAITDLLFAVFCIPFTTYLYLFDSWNFGALSCKINHFMSHASVQATCLTLTAMTIHRCKTIIKNETVAMKTVKSSKRRANVIKILAFIWFVAVLVASPDLFYFTVQSHGNQTYCIIVQDNSIVRFYLSISNFVSIATTYVIPLTIIIVSYARLLSHIRSSQKQLANFNINTRKGPRDEAQRLRAVPNEERPASRNTSNRNRKVTIMVVLFTVNFAFCWFSTHLLIIIRACINIRVESELYVYLSFFKIIAHTLSYLTPVINPCLYAFFNENFRSSLRDLFRLVRCKQPVRNPHQPEPNHSFV
nr:G protein-coupled receptor [Proales similis]